MMMARPISTIWVDLFKGVTQRFQPNVRMTQLPNIKYDQLKAVTEEIYPVYEKCCRIIRSHSQPMEILNVSPTIDELETDWKTIQETRKTIV